MSPPRAPDGYEIASFPVNDERGGPLATGFVICDRCGALTGFTEDGAYTDCHDAWHAARVTQPALLAEVPERIPVEEEDRFAGSGGSTP